MDNTEAIGILRGTASPASVMHPQIAADMGADALAAWELVERHKPVHFEYFECPYSIIRMTYLLQHDGWVEFPSIVAPTPLAAVLDEMKKEATDGR